MYLPVYLERSSEVISTLSVPISLPEFEIPRGAKWLFMSFGGDQSLPLVQWFRNHGQCVWQLQGEGSDLRDRRERKLALQIAERALRHGLKVFVWFAFGSREWYVEPSRGVRDGSDLHQELVAKRLDARQLVDTAFLFFIGVNSKAQEIFGKPGEVENLKVYGAFSWPTSCVGWRQDFMQKWFAMFPCTAWVEHLKIKTDFVPLVVCLRSVEASGRQRKGSKHRVIDFANEVGQAILTEDGQKHRQEELTEVQSVDVVEAFLQPCLRCGYMKLCDFPCPSHQCARQAPVSASSFEAEDENFQQTMAMLVDMGFDPDFVL